MDIWVGDSAGSAGADVRSACRPADFARLAWAGDRLLYGTVVGGKYADRSSHARGEHFRRAFSDAQSPAATTDGGRIVFVSTSA